MKLTIRCGNSTQKSSHNTGTINVHNITNNYYFRLQFCGAKILNFSVLKKLDTYIKLFYIF